MKAKPISLTTGIAATTTVGNVTVSADALAPVTGEEATSAVVSVLQLMAKADADVAVTGVAATDCGWNRDCSSDKSRCSCYGIVNFYFCW